MNRNFMNTRGYDDDLPKDRLPNELQRRDASNPASNDTDDHLDDERLHGINNIDDLSLEYSYLMKSPLQGSLLSLLIAHDITGIKIEKFISASIVPSALSLYFEKEGRLLTYIFLRCVMGHVAAIELHDALLKVDSNELAALSQYVGKPLSTRGDVLKELKSFVKYHPGVIFKVKNLVKQFPTLSKTIQTIF